MHRKFAVLLFGGLPWRRTPALQEALPFGNESVLSRTLRAYREGGAAMIVLATGPIDRALGAILEPHRGELQVVELPEAPAALAPYIARGARALSDWHDPFAIGFTDMPLLTGALISTLWAAFNSSGKPIGVPTCQGSLGYPVFLAGQLRNELEQLSPPRTHRDFIFSRGDDVALLDTQHTAVLRMIDGLPEYREVLALAQLPRPDGHQFLPHVPDDAPAPGIPLTG